MGSAFRATVSYGREARWRAQIDAAVHALPKRSKIIMPSPMIGGGSVELQLPDDSNSSSPKQSVCYLIGSQLHTIAVNTD